MRGCFTILQGGLADTRPRSGGSDAMRAAGWQVVLRRAGTLHESECAAWRSLCARLPRYDPFSDPDFLLSAARHLARPGEVTFALAHTVAENSDPILRGVVPLVLPHAVWGGSQVRLWHPPIAPRPVDPLSEPGTGSATIEAVITHLARLRSRISLRLDRISADSRLLRDLSADRRLRVEAHPSPAPIPAGQFIEITARETPTWIERVSAVDEVRDATERFLLTDARRSRRRILADPGAATAIRVTTRLFARRGLALIELGHRGADIVSGAIHLGRPEARVLWLSVNLATAPLSLLQTSDVVVRLSEESRMSERPARLRVVTS